MPHGPRWQAPAWAWILTLPALALLCGLGLWQLQRGSAKQALDTQYARAADEPALQLTAGLQPPVQGVQRAQATGVWRADWQLLLDNQSYRKRPGYQVWTPLELADGSLLLVNRGWVPQNPDRRVKPELPLPSLPVQVSGYWRALPQPGLRLPAGETCAEPDFPQVVQYPEAAQLACLLPAPVLPGLLLLDPEAPSGFVRDWRIAAEVPPTRHYGYAAQWFAFAATLLFLFIKLNFKPRS
jgi:surfeit locus 1 family protein